MTALGSPSVSNCSPEAHWKPGPWGPTLSFSVVSVLKLSFKWYHIFTWVNFGKSLLEHSLLPRVGACTCIYNALLFYQNMSVFINGFKQVKRLSERSLNSCLRGLSM